MEDLAQRRLILACRGLSALPDCVWVLTRQNVTLIFYTVYLLQTYKSAASRSAAAGKRARRFAPKTLNITLIGRSALLPCSARLQHAAQRVYSAPQDVPPWCRRARNASLWNVQANSLSLPGLKAVWRYHGSLTANCSQ